MFKVLYKSLVKSSPFGIQRPHKVLLPTVEAKGITIFARVLLTIYAYDMVIPVTSILSADVKRQPILGG